MIPTIISETMLRYLGPFLQVLLVLYGVLFVLGFGVACYGFWLTRKRTSG